MARTDIEYSVQNGDIVIMANKPNDDDVIDATLNGDTITIDQPFDGTCIIKLSLTELTGEALIIEANGVAYELYFKMGDGEEIPVTAAMLPYISFDYFRITVIDDMMLAYISSGYTHDLNVVPAKEQNSSLLTICDKGNNYRYPSSGVGVHRYINNNSGATKSELASNIIKQFNSDSVTVIKAAYDEETGALQLVTKEN